MYFILSESPTFLWMKVILFVPLLSSNEQFRQCPAAAENHHRHHHHPPFQNYIFRSVWSCQMFRKCSPCALQIIPGCYLLFGWKFQEIWAWLSIGRNFAKCLRRFIWKCYLSVFVTKTHNIDFCRRDWEWWMLEVWEACLGPLPLCTSRCFSDGGHISRIVHAAVCAATPLMKRRPEYGFNLVEALHHKSSDFVCLLLLF